MSMISYRACDMCKEPMSPDQQYLQVRMIGKHRNGNNTNSNIRLDTNMWKGEVIQFRDGTLDVCVKCANRIGVQEFIKPLNSNASSQRVSNNDRFPGCDAEY